VLNVDETGHPENGQRLWNWGFHAPGPLGFALFHIAQRFRQHAEHYFRFLEKSFGWEDRFFHVGTSVVEEDWPYVIPGPSDEWGGTWATSGWRSHVLTVLFEPESRPDQGPWRLIVDVQDCAVEDPPLFKAAVNGSDWKASSWQPTTRKVYLE
jgi:hypothetical protein